MFSHKNTLNNVTTPQTGCLPKKLPVYISRIFINNEQFFKLSLPLKKVLMGTKKKTIPCKKDSQVNHCPLHKNTKWVCP